MMNKVHFSCGPFDLDGFSTDDNVYPLPWKFAKFFITLGFVIMTLTSLLTIATFCRQSIFGKSIHTITGSAQAIAGDLLFYALLFTIEIIIFVPLSFPIAICVLIALFLHPFGWSHER